MAAPNFRNIYQTPQSSACKEDKGVQLKIQKETGLLWHVAIRVARGTALSRFLSLTLPISHR